MSEKNDNQQPPQPEKMGLTSKREVPLSMFVYIIREGYDNAVATPQNVSFITAYTNEEALASVRKQFPAGMHLTIEQKGQVPMAKIIEMFQKTIDLNGTPLAVEPKQQPEPEIVARTKRDFYQEIVSGMIKSAADFTNNEQEKNILLVALHKMLSLVQ